MQNSPKELWKSTKEWRTSIFQRWWDMLNIPIAAIPLIYGIFAVVIKTRNADPPLSLWDIGILIGGAILFIIVTFFAFHQVRVERDKVIGKDLPISDNEIKLMEWRKEYRKPQEPSVSQIPNKLKLMWSIVDNILIQKKKEPKPSEEILMNLILNSLETDKGDPLFKKENYSTDQRSRKTIRKIAKRMGLKKPNAQLEALWRRRVADDMDDAKIGLNLKNNDEYNKELNALKEDREPITKTKIDNKIDIFVENLTVLYSLKLFIYYGGTTEKLYIFPRDMRDWLMHFEDNIERVMRSNFTQVTGVLEEYAIGKDLE
jgi:hypothetical protein